MTLSKLYFQFKDPNTIRQFVYVEILLNILQLKRFRQRIFYCCKYYCPCHSRYSLRHSNCDSQHLHSYSTCPNINIQKTCHSLWSIARIVAKTKSRKLLISTKFEMSKIFRHFKQCWFIMML